MISLNEPKISLSCGRNLASSIGGGRRKPDIVGDAKLESNVHQHPPLRGVRVLGSELSSSDPTFCKPPPASLMTAVALQAILRF